MIQKGFTLIEMILSLVITAIIAGVMVEIIAGPIRSYFWLNEQSSRVQVGSMGLDNMARELRLALPSSIHIESKQNQQALKFRKILYKGLMITPILSTPFPQELINTKEPLMIYFPTLNEPESFYALSLKNEKTQGKINIKNTLMPVEITPGLLFYIVSEPILYECQNKSQLLERTVASFRGKSLLANNIQNCQFTIISEQKREGVILSFRLGMTDAQAFSMVTPVLFGGP